MKDEAEDDDQGEEEEDDDDEDESEDEEDDEDEEDCEQVGDVQMIAGHPGSLLLTLLLFFALHIFTTFLLQLTISSRKMPHLPQLLPPEVDTCCLFISFFLK